MKNLGDAIARNPIVKAIGRATGCVDPVTNQLRPESTCNQVRVDLNEGRYRDAIYDRFFRRAEETKPKEK